MNVAIPYALTPAVKLEQRYEHMKSAIRRNLPRLRHRTVDDSKVAHIAAYGPSLMQTWPALRDAAERGEAIFSMSGATKFLAERGIIPTYHVDMDPRENKVMTSLPPIKGVTYLVASVCCPAYFDALVAAGVDTMLWHTVSSNWQQDLDWIAVHDPGEYVVSSGSTIGMGAIQVAGVLGYRRYEVHGMDSSFAEGGERHAGPHAGKTQHADTQWQVLNRIYRTSKIMANAAAEAFNLAKNFPIITVWHGEGLSQALIRKGNLDNACCADETEKRARLSQLRPHVVRLPSLSQGRRTFWQALTEHLQPEDLPELVHNIARCEARRSGVRSNQGERAPRGSIPFESAVYLRALCRFYEPQVIAEIGTFIGSSTEALVGRVIHTCDLDNDVVASGGRIRAYPRTNSTVMLQSMTEPVDLFFIDGRLRHDDLELVLKLSHVGTVYVVDDYTGHEKGVANVNLLMPKLKTRYAVMAPDPGVSTLAVLVPVANIRTEKAEE